METDSNILASPLSNKAQTFHHMKIIEFNEIISGFQKTISIVNKSREEILVTGIDDNDCRVLFFSFSLEILQNYYIAIKLAEKIPDLLKSPNNNTLNRVQISYIEEMKSSLFLSYFANMEMCIRLLNTKSKSESNFLTTIKPLIKNANFNDTDMNILFEIWAYTRNTIHNYGVHTKSEITKTYDNKLFKFEKDKQIDFLNFNTIEFLIIESNNAIKKLICSSPIKEERQLFHPIKIQ